MAFYIWNLFETVSKIFFYRWFFFGEHFFAMKIFAQTKDNFFSMIFLFFIYLFFFVFNEFFKPFFMKIFLIIFLVKFIFFGFKVFYYVIIFLNNINLKIKFIFLYIFLQNFFLIFLRFFCFDKIKLSLIVCLNDKIFL